MEHLIPVLTDAICFLLDLSSIGFVFGKRGATPMYKRRETLWNQRECPSLSLSLSTFPLRKRPMMSVVEQRLEIKRTRFDSSSALCLCATEWWLLCNPWLWNGIIFHILTIMRLFFRLKGTWGAATSEDDCAGWMLCGLGLEWQFSWNGLIWWLGDSKRAQGERQGKETIWEVWTEYIPILSPPSTVNFTARMANYLCPLLSMLHLPLQLSHVTWPVCQNCNPPVVVHRIN